MSTKRPGTMSDEERALAAMERRRKQTPALGVPVTEFDKDDHTPVGTIIERIEDELGDELSARERRIVQAFGRHTANMELRARQRRDTGDTASLERRLDAAERSIVDIAGKNGSNGKVGTLKERVDKAEARRWWAVTFVAGLVVAALSFAFSFGSRIGSLEAEVEALKARRGRAHVPGFQPEYPAPKEGNAP